MIKYSPSILSGMLVFGGHDGAKHLNDFYELNFTTLQSAHSTVPQDFPTNLGGSLAIAFITLCSNHSNAAGCVVWLSRGRLSNPIMLLVTALAS